MGENLTIEPAIKRSPTEVSDAVLEEYRLSEEPFHVALTKDKKAGAYELVTAYVGARIHKGQWMCVTDTSLYFLIENGPEGWVAYQSPLLRYANKNVKDLEP